MPTACPDARDAGAGEEGTTAAGTGGLGHGQTGIGHRWTDRKQLLHLVVSSLDSPRTVETRPDGFQRLKSEAPAYLCLKQVSQNETDLGQLRQERPAWPTPGGAAAERLAWVRQAARGPAPVARFVGRLGPSLFMTAVERRDQQQKGREALERLGRHCRRLLGMTAEERAINDLPQRQGLREALAAPAGRFADLLAEGLQEGAQRWDRATKAHALARLQAGGSDGLDPCAKSAQATDTHGWRGLTTAGRRSIKDAAAVMDEHRGTLGFWTVTLSEEAAQTATREQVATFQTRLLFFARRMMIRRGVDPFAVVVCELHPGRRTMDGARVPHWHAIVRVSHRPYAKWAVKVADWHAVVAAAHRSAFGKARGHTHGCKMLPQKTGAARYLAKYMSKACSDVAPLRGTAAGRMVPRQWWTWTGEVRAAVQACRVRPPSAFLSWTCRWWRELIELGELQSSEAIQIGEEGAIVGRWFVWSSEEALDRAIEQWAGEELARLDELRAPPG